MKDANRHREHLIDEADKRADIVYRYIGCGVDDPVELIAAEIRKFVRREREACAEIAEKSAACVCRVTIAENIRSRGAK